MDLTMSNFLKLQEGTSLLLLPKIRLIHVADLQFLVKLALSSEQITQSKGAQLLGCLIEEVRRLMEQ
jgi:hypothetical protein